MLPLLHLKESSDRIKREVISYFRAFSDKLIAHRFEVTLLFARARSFPYFILSGRNVLFHTKILLKLLSAIHSQLVASAIWGRKSGAVTLE